jgi:hypothetical protein
VLTVTVEMVAGTCENRLRIGSVNVGTMSGRAAELVEMVSRRRLDFCCLQETKWKGDGTRVFEMIKDKSYKFFWCGGVDRVAGVGILVAEKWIASVVQVERVCERIMVLKVRVGSSALNVISAYAPQPGRPKGEKEEFYARLLKVVSGLHEEENLFIGGDMNGHVGSETDGFTGVHGGHGFGQRNLEGELLLEFAEAAELVVCNTCFVKEETKLITYASGGRQTVTDYALVRQRQWQKMVTNVKVIPGESCVPQHRLLVCVLQLNSRGTTQKAEYIPRIRVWKLKDAEVQQRFQQEVQMRAAGREDGDVDSKWNGLKACLLDSARITCGYTKGPPRHKQTWWWNKDVALAVESKRLLFKWWQSTRSETDKATYQTAKRRARKEVASAKEAERVKICTGLEEAEGKGNLFRVVKQMRDKNKDVVGGGAVKDGSGRIVTEEDKVREVWQEYFRNLLNEEFEWDKSSVQDSTTGSPGTARGTCKLITEGEVRKAMSKMKNGKAAGPSGIVAEMLKAAGNDGVQWMTELCNAVIQEGRIPDDWRKSWMTAVYKGKGDALDCSSYRGIKLLDHVMKVMERVLEARLRSQVVINDMQFGFREGRGTTDAIFIVRQLQEKYLAKGRELWLAFVDLEKAFDRVPRDVVWWALKSLGVDDELINIIRSMYENVMTSVKLNDGESEAFAVRVGVHQGSVLSPLLFIIVLEALSRAFRDGLPLELLYADDLALAAESEKQLMEKIKRWKDGMEEKGLRVNVGKSKVMRSAMDVGQTVDTGKYPCGVCRQGVGKNSILCSSCKKWVHHRCSGIPGKLKEMEGYKCPRCIRNEGGEGKSDSEVRKELILDEGVKFEMVDSFCYLGDMISAGGGAVDASRARVRSGWKKFQDLAPVLTLRGASLKLKGKIYSICVRRAMVYGSETWPVKVEDMNRLERAEKSMMRRMCGVTLSDKVPSDELRARLGIESISRVVTSGRLRWFGHVERKEEGDWVKDCTEMKVAGESGKGRPRKTWNECVKGDLKRLRLDVKDVEDRDGWRSLVRDRLTHASVDC